MRHISNARSPHKDTKEREIERERERERERGKIVADLQERD
jgi:hypothetical protein